MIRLVTHFATTEQHVRDFVGCVEKALEEQAA